MSLDSNLYEKSIKILTDLISFKTISGKENGPLSFPDIVLKLMRSDKILIDFLYKLLSKLINLIIYYYYERTNNLRYI